jgi:hypothetical protein
VAFKARLKVGTPTKKMCRRDIRRRDGTVQDKPSRNTRTLKVVCFNAANRTYDRFYFYTGGQTRLPQRHAVRKDIVSLSVVFVVITLLLYYHQQIKTTSFQITTQARPVEMPMYYCAYVLFASRTCLLRFQ